MVELLEAAVAEMHQRAADFGGQDPDVRGVGVGVGGVPVPGRDHRWNARLAKAEPADELAANRVCSAA